MLESVERRTPSSAAVPTILAPGLDDLRCVEAGGPGDVYCSSCDICRV